MIGIIIAAVWQMSGYTMALYLAGLRGIPEETIEDPGVIGWYEYNGTYTVAATADRVGRVLMHVREGAKGWELWSLRGPIAAKGEDTEVEWIPTLKRGDCSTPTLAIAEGNSHLRANKAVTVPILAEWKGADATPGQKGLARKWGVKRDLDDVTMGECSALIDSAQAKRTVDDHLDPGLKNRREHAWAVRQRLFRRSA